VRLPTEAGNAGHQQKGNHMTYQVIELRGAELADARRIGTALTCGTCGRSWDDSISTSVTPVPAGRCPWESHHEDDDEDEYQSGAEALVAELARIELTEDTDPQLREFIFRSREIVRYMY
jgi:hypothetical protein